MFDYSDWKGAHEKEIQQEYENQKRSGQEGPYVAIAALKIVRDRDAAKYFSFLRPICIADVNRGGEKRIAKPVVDALNAAKKHIRDAREDVKKAFATLCPKEQEEARHVLDAVVTRFDQLEESIDDRQREIIGDLARTY